MSARIRSPRGASPPARALGILALLACLSGCKAAERQEAPPVTLSSSWSERAPSADLEAGPEWWRSFGNRELDRLVATGLAESPTLAAAAARIAQARAAAAIAAAVLVPGVSAVDSVDRSVGVSEKIRQTFLVQASYEVDFWGRNRALAASATTLAEASALDAETARLLLAAGIVNTYFQVVSLRERVEQAREAAEDARRVLALVRAQREAGTATDLQVEQQSSALGTFEATVPVLIQQREAAQHLLAVLVGTEPATLRVQGRSLAAIRRPVPAVAQPGTLLVRRPDLRAAEERLAAAGFDIAAARAAFLPRLVIGGGFGHIAETTSGLLPSALLTNLAAGLTQPLFDGGRLEGALTLTQERRAELLALYRLSVLTALQDVEDAMSALRNLRLQEGSSRLAVTSGRRARTIAEQQYRIGTADYLTVLNTQRTLYGAEDALLQVQFAQCVALVGLYRAIGGGFGARPVLAATERGAR